MRVPLFYVISVISVALWFLSCLPPAAAQQATLTATNVTVEAGTPTARIPILVSAEEGQTIAGLAMTVQVGAGDQMVRIVDSPERYGDHQSGPFSESVFNAHRRVLVIVQPLGGNTANYLAMAWRAPWDAIEADGVVCIVSVDTSSLPAGEYPVTTDPGGRTSATTTIDGVTWRPLRLDHKPGVLTVVPPRPRNVAE